MNPKSGKEAVADTPDSPVAAEVADTAHFGEGQAARGGGEENGASSDREKVWISIELKDEDGNAVPNAAYEIYAPNENSPRTGKLNNRGKATIEGIVAGTCQVCFPDIHGDEWQKVAENNKKGG